MSGLRGEGAIEVGAGRTKTCSDYASASEKISSPLTRGERKNCPAFSRSSGPIALNLQVFLR
jgi:hypothetical protein